MAVEAVKMPQNWSNFMILLGMMTLQCTDSLCHSTPTWNHVKYLTIYYFVFSGQKKLNCMVTPYVQGAKNSKIKKNPVIFQKMKVFPQFDQFKMSKIQVFCFNSRISAILNEFFRNKKKKSKMVAKAEEIPYFRPFLVDFWHFYNFFGFRSATNINTSASKHV